MNLRSAPDRARRPTALAALALLLSLAPGTAALAVLTPDLEAKGWRELPTPNKPGNQFSLGEDGVIEVVSKNSVSTLYQPVEVDLGQRPILTWRWRVDQATPATDLTVKGKDDCSLSVYVGFPYRPEQASFMERVKRPLVELLAGKDAPGRALRYVFCGERARGEMVESPYMGSAGMIKILRPSSSPTGEWFEEQVDVAADYRAAFGGEPQNPSQIAIEADTDNTHSASRAEVADLEFIARNAAAGPGSERSDASFGRTGPPLPRRPA
jgi:hypothetical protein